MNYLNHINELSNNINYEGFITKKEYNQNQLINEVILSLMNILNDDNKKEHIKMTLNILLKIIKYLKKESDRQEKEAKENNKTFLEIDAIEIILNSFIKDVSKNINKEYKMTIIYYIASLFNNKINKYFEDLVNLIIDSIKNEELVDISLSILIALLDADSQSIESYFPKLIPILIELLNKKFERMESILFQEDPIISKIIDCFSIMSDKISDYLKIILDEIFYLLNLSIINIQKKNIDKDNDEGENITNNKNNKNSIHNFQLFSPDNRKSILNININNKQNNHLESEINFNSNLLFNNNDSTIFNNSINNNSLNATNSPLDEGKIARNFLRKNSAIPSTSSAKKRLSILRSNTINNENFKKLLDILNNIFSLDNFHEYLPQLIIILNKYICFCPESRKEIIDFFFDLLKKKPNEMNCFLPNLFELIDKYEISIIDYSKKMKNCFNYLDNSFDEDKNLRYNKQKLSINDNLLIEKYILNKSFSSDDEKENNMSKNFEKILDDFNPENYS
jgi:hypothetical protein